MIAPSKTPVKSPCVHICALDDNGLCMGCYRTGAEISQWGAMNDDERRNVMQQVAERERAAMKFIEISSK